MSPLLIDALNSAATNGESSSANFWITQEGTGSSSQDLPAALRNDGVVSWRDRWSRTERNWRCMAGYRKHRGCSRCSWWLYARQLHPRKRSRRLSALNSSSFFFRMLARYTSQTLIPHCLLYYEWPQSLNTAQSIWVLHRDWIILCT